MNSAAEPTTGPNTGPTTGPTTRPAPTVSVVIPNYNYEKTLRACLESVYAQTHRPFEVIVVDDASTDRSRDIARRFPCTLIEQPVNRGVSAARNAGAALARGEILFFLDSDVGLAPDALACAIEVLRADPHCVCVYGIYGKRPLIDDGPVEWYRILHLHHALVRGVGPTATAVFALAALPRAVFDEVGPFDENLRAAEDDEYSDRLLAHGRIRLAGTVVGHHDEADRLPAALAEQYKRAQLMPFAIRNRMRRDALKVNRGTGVAAAALTLATAPLPLLWPALAVVPPAFLCLFAIADPGLARFVLREKGPAFLCFFIVTHLMVNLALVAGAATGWLRAAVNPSFGPSARRGRPAGVHRPDPRGGATP